MIVNSNQHCCKFETVIIVNSNQHYCKFESYYYCHVFFMYYYRFFLSVIYNVFIPLYLCFCQERNKKIEVLLCIFLDQTTNMDAYFVNTSRIHIKIWLPLPSYFSIVKKGRVYLWCIFIPQTWQESYRKCVRNLQLQKIEQLWNKWSSAVSALLSDKYWPNL